MLAEAQKTLRLAPFASLLRFSGAGAKLLRQRNAHRLGAERGMGGIDKDWDEARDQLAYSIEFETRDRVIDLLDQAATAARENRLHDAAKHLKEVRRNLVELGTFNSWDMASGGLPA